MPVPLLVAQQVFATRLCRLVLALNSRGYLVTMGEVWRSDETAKLNEELGKGIDKSLHRIRLACDLNIFKNGKLLTGIIDLLEACETWEEMSSDGLRCCWGGRFETPDTDHFSIEWGGVK